MANIFFLVFFIFTIFWRYTLHVLSWKEAFSSKYQLFVNFRCFAFFCASAYFSWCYTIKKILKMKKTEFFYLSLIIIMGWKPHFWWPFRQPIYTIPLTQSFSFGPNREFPKIQGNPWKSMKINENQPKSMKINKN